MPLNSFTRPLAMPCTLPEVVSTVWKMPPCGAALPRMRSDAGAGGWPSAGWALAALVTAVAAAPATVATRSRSRRLRVSGLRVMICSSSAARPGSRRVGVPVRADLGAGVHLLARVVVEQHDVALGVAVGLPRRDMGVVGVAGLGEGREGGGQPVGHLLAARRAREEPVAVGVERGRDVDPMDGAELAVIGARAPVPLVDIGRRGPQGGLARGLGVGGA